MDPDFRIVLMGQAAFGESVLKTLVDKGEHVAAVFCAPDKEGKPIDPVKSAALERSIPVFQFRRMRDAGAVAAFKALKAGLGVMAYVTDIVPEAILEAPRHGTIQYHPSLLPRHRGPSSINWPIIQGETKTGLSIFWPDKGIDTGPILIQKEVDIAPDDTLGTLYFNKLFPLGVEAMAEAVQLVKRGQAPRIPQDESQATYEGWCKADDAVIDWSRPLDELYNLIRGADPSPGANSTLNGERISFYNASKSASETGEKPGTILEITPEGLRIAAPGGALLVRRVQPPRSAKLPATDWARAANLNPGAKFGNE
jgi:methionyl-tRNA formyltransferase